MGYGWVGAETLIDMRGIQERLNSSSETVFEHAVYASIASGAIQVNTIINT